MSAEDDMMEIVRKQNLDAAKMIVSTLLSIVVARHTNHEKGEIDFDAVIADLPGEFERATQALLKDAILTLNMHREKLSQVLKGENEKWITKTKL